jgi:hypothetical protein
MTFFDTPNGLMLSMHVDFQDFLRFQPKGQGNMFVTIARNGWSVAADVSLGGQTTPPALAPAIPAVRSNQFPLWT